MVTRPVPDARDDRPSSIRQDPGAAKSSGPSSQAILFGGQLRRVRERQGLSQQAVADALGVTRTAVTHMESGERAVKTHEIMRLAKTYGCTEMALLGLSERLSLDDLYEVLLRELPEMRAEDEAGLEMRRTISLCQEGVLMRGFLGHPVEPEIPDYSAKMTKAADAIRQGESAAHAERHRLGLGSAPVRNIAGLLCAQGIWAMATKLPSGLSGLFLGHPSIGLMTLASREHWHVRRRFSYSHEYAHALFDRDSVVVVTRKPGSDDLKEMRANAFAAAFLMPRDGIERQLELMGKGLPSRRTHILYDAANDEPTKTAVRPRPGSQALSFTDAVTMARHFGIGYDAIVWRLRTLALIDAKEGETLINAKDLGELYIRTMGIEGHGDKGLDPVAASREAHIRIANLAIEAHRQREISQGKVMEIGRDLQVDSMEFLEVAAASRAICGS